jgi:hypothetical protein
LTRIIYRKIVVFLTMAASESGVQQRLGHRKPDTTLRIYTHAWKYRDAQKSRIGAHIGQLFNDTDQKQLRPGRRQPLWLLASQHQ